MRLVAERLGDELGVEAFGEIVLMADGVVILGARTLRL